MAVAVSVLMGCGGSAPPSEMPTRRLSGEHDPSDDEAPRFAITGLELPEPPASVDVDDPALEPIIGYARELLERAPPSPEGELDASGTSAFVEGRLASWMGSQAQSIRALWTAMQELGTNVLGAHVVARAITGSTLVALAERIEGLRLPGAVGSDASEERAVREALASTARPMRDRGVQALGSCASAAVGSADPTIDEWRLYCDSEIQRSTRH